MKYQYQVTFLACILLSSCGGESNRSSDTVNIVSTGDTSGSADNSNNSLIEPGEHLNVGIEPADVKISPEYGSNNSIVANVLVSSGTGDTWADFWVTEQENSSYYSLVAAAETDDVWQTPVTLTDHLLATEIDSSDDQILVAWGEKTPDANNADIHRLQARVLRNDQWLPAVTVFSASADNAGEQITDTAMAAMPGNRFALLWTRQGDNGDELRQIREWSVDHWSATQKLPVLESTTRTNQLVAAADGSLSNLYSRFVTDENEGSELSYWVQDRIAGIWHTPVRIDQVDLPLWLTGASQSQHVMDSTDSGKQIVAWVIRLTDSFGTRYYGIGSARREGPGRLWSFHFELTGTDSIEQLQAAITDDGHTGISWLVQTGLSRHELMLSRYTPDSGWLPVDENILRSEFFPDLPPEPATYYPGTGRLTMAAAADGIHLSTVTEVGYLETGSYYYSLQSAVIGFSESPITEAVEVSRAGRQRMLSCDSDNVRLRCSRTSTRFNRSVTTPSLLQTEQISVTEVSFSSR